MRAPAFKARQKQNATLNAASPPIRLVENALSHSIHKKRIEHPNSSESEYTMCNVHDLGNMRAACEEENPTTF